MQAIVQDSYGSADVLQLREIVRAQIGANEVLVRVHATLDNSAVSRPARPTSLQASFGQKPVRTSGMI